MVNIKFSNQTVGRIGIRTDTNPFSENNQGPTAKDRDIFPEKTPAMGVFLLYILVV